MFGEFGDAAQMSCGSSSCGVLYDEAAFVPDSGGQSTKGHCVGGSVYMHRDGRSDRLDR